MAIEFRCPSCNSLFRLKDELAGRRAKCPKCKTSVTIPSAAPEPASPVAAPSEKPVASSSAEPIAFKCECGASLRVKAELAGKQVTCPKCSEATTVPDATPEAEPDEDELDEDELDEDEPERTSSLSSVRRRRRKKPAEETTLMKVLSFLLGLAFLIGVGFGVKSCFSDGASSAEEQTTKVASLISSARLHIEAGNGAQAKTCLQQAMELKSASNVELAQNLWNIIGNGLGKSVRDIRLQLPLLQKHEYERDLGAHGLPRHKWRFDADLNAIPNTDGLHTWITLSGPGDDIVLVEGGATIPADKSKNTQALSSMLMVTKMIQITTNQDDKSFQSIFAWVTAGIKVLGAEKDFGSVRVKFRVIRAKGGGLLLYTVKNARCTIKQ